jgi:CheY-like chemotaxis protein
MSSVISSVMVNGPVSNHGATPPVTVGVLIVSSNYDLRHELASRLQSSRWDVQQETSGASALEQIHDRRASLVLLDPTLPDLKVEEFREIIEANYPEVEVIPVNSRTGQPMLSVPSPGSACFELVRELERRGPFSVEKPSPSFVLDNFGKDDSSLPGFVGSAPAVQRLCAMVRLVAQRDTTVLITGESGTGKDLVASAVHDHLSLSTAPRSLNLCSKRSYSDSSRGPSLGLSNPASGESRPPREGRFSWMKLANCPWDCNQNYLDLWSKGKFSDWEARTPFVWMFV